MLDDLRSYLQMASGITEATTSKAKDVVTGLLTHGLSLSSKAMPAPEMMGQVQELADDLVATSRNNREMLVGMIRAEVDRAVGRMGFVREDELAALRRHVQRLEKQITDLEKVERTAGPAAAPTAPAAPAEPAQTPSEQPAAPAEGATEAGPHDEVPVKKKKKKVLVVQDEPGDSA